MMSMLSLSYQDVQHCGLWIATGSRDGSASTFSKLYGSLPHVVAAIWKALQTTENGQAKLSNKENTIKGFDQFLIALFFLWTYPKNSTLTATWFKICEKQCQGIAIWQWVSKIQGLKETTIVWEPHLDDKASEILVMSVDGTDFRIWEPKHPLFPIDKGFCSHKFKHAAVKYAVAISVRTGNCVWINGPF